MVSQEELEFWERQESMENLLDDASIEADIDECVRIMNAFDKDRDWLKYKPTQGEIEAECALMEWCFTPSSFAQKKALEAKPFGIAVWDPCTLTWDVR